MKVYLRAFEQEDSIKINKWRNDDEVQSLTGGNKYFVSLAKEKKWVDELIFDNSKNIYLAICLKETSEMVGYTGIRDIDWRNRKVEWTALVIGDRECRSKGYATEATLLLLDYVFLELGIHRLTGYSLKSNKSSLKLFEKLGFKQDGVLRESVFKSNSYHDNIVFSLLKYEYEEIKNRFQEKFDSI
jgi:[ribosomal protein S5]-alanine N-acetyltransferase